MTRGALLARATLAWLAVARSLVLAAGEGDGIDELVGDRREEGLDELAHQADPRLSACLLEKRILGPGRRKGI